jgi:nucleotide-binding universal stress UspA family protein
VAADLRRHANQALERFEEEARQAGVASFERRLIEGDAASGLSRQGPCCDLMILGQGGAGAFPPGADADLLQYVVLNCGCPVLIVPDGGPFRIPGRRALVAWNGSAPAAHALRSALPLLMRTEGVDVAMVNPGDMKTGPYGAEPGTDIALYLARHGIAAAIVQENVNADAGHALLSLAAGRSADWMVMGCVAHPRYPGVLLGGATRVVLSEAAIPVLMAH